MTMRTIKPISYKESVGPMSMPDKTYPEFSLSLKDIPQAKEWEVGDTYIIEMKVRQSSMNISKNGPGRVSFEILSIGEVESEEEEDDEEESDQEDYSHSRMSK